jgi:xanthine dehydrogenase YagS FAD-binding subunit
VNRFDYINAASVSHAMSVLRSDPAAQLLAGGTNLVDLMKYDIAKPTTLVSIKGLPLRDIVETPRGLRVGALATNTDVAYHPLVVEQYPVLASALLAGASTQLRNVATAGGNLLQRTRCAYFYDVETNCNKRMPGSGCPARTGLNRNHAILGASASCIATHPSDMCVALAALDAIVMVEGPYRAREIPFSDLHRLPGETPEQDTNLEHGEIITAIDLPMLVGDVGYSYLKVRDRLSYAFALVAVAALVKVENGGISFARLALGGVAHKPWRDVRAERSLIGRPANRESFSAFADALLSTATAQSRNSFKIELARRTLIRSLEQAAARTPQSQSDKRVR